MEDYSTHGSGTLFWLGVIVVAGLLVGMAALLLTERITEHQSIMAQQATIQEQARANAAIQQAREQTEQTREHEQARSERWEAFLIAMKTSPTDETGLLLIGLVITEVCVLIYLWLKDRHD